MTKQKTTKRAVLLSVLSLLMCVTMFVGSTFAWFTDSVTSSNNKIATGNLDVELYWSSDATNWSKVADDTNVFEKGTLWEPGHTEVVYLKIVNEGTLALKYQLSVNVVSEKEGTNVADEKFRLSDYIQYCVIDDRDTKYENRNEVHDAIEKLPMTELSWAYVTKDALTSNGETYLALVVCMPETVGNEANYKTNTTVPEINLGINLLATQYAYEEDSFGKDYDENATFWDGFADISWYNSEANYFELTTATQLAGLAQLVNEKTDNFAGKTISLGADIDLTGHNFTPIGGLDKENAFEGVFDGQGHTILGLTENGWELGYYYGQTAGMGLFGWIGDATIKNVNIDDAEVSMEAVVMGVVAGYAAGDCTFENITVSNTQIANYNWDTGGIVGQVYGIDSAFTFKDINIDESTTISGHWGTWDVSAGGVIGRTANGVSVSMENVTVAAKLDVFNDVCAAYQWYAYRYSGMLVGYTKTTETVDGRTVATAPHVTCNNVTVIYNDWANYTYCQASNVAPQYVRVQGGYSTDPYYSGRHWTAGVDTNGNKMVDDNHVHADGEAHNKLIVFDQLFGGGQGVYGTATHDGVTVIYNNK